MIPLLILKQLISYVPLMCGAYISFMLLRIPNIAIESAFVCGAIIGVQCGIIAAICAGALVGLVSGLLMYFARMSALFANIITIGLFHGFNQMMMGSAHLTVPQVLRTHHLYSAIVAALGATLFLYLFCTRQIGYAAFIYGRNQNFLKIMNVSRAFVLLVSLLCANGLAGLNGYSIALSHGFVDLSMGMGLSLTALTVLIMGSIFVGSKPLNPLIPFIGFGCYLCVQHILMNVGLSMRYFMLLQSLAVLIVIGIARFYAPNRFIEEVAEL